MARHKPSTSPHPEPGWLNIQVGGVELTTRPSCPMETGQPERSDRPDLRGVADAQRRWWRLRKGRTTGGTPNVLRCSSVSPGSDREGSFPSEVGGSCREHPPVRHRPGPPGGADHGIAVGLSQARRPRGSFSRRARGSSTARSATSVTRSSVSSGWQPAELVSGLRRWFPHRRLGPASTGIGGTGQTRELT
jgi:hypothetical protein